MRGSGVSSASVPTLAECRLPSLQFLGIMRPRPVLVCGSLRTFCFAVVCGDAVEAGTERAAEVLNRPILQRQKGNPMKQRLWLLAFMICLGLTGFSGAFAGDPDQTLPSPDRSTAGNLGSLSKRLSEFSAAARSRDFTRLARYFHRSVRSGAWLPPAATPAPAGGIVHSRRLGSNVRSLRHSRAEVLRNWEQFLDRFGRIENVRFALTDAESAGAETVWVQDASVEFVLTGSAPDGSLLWVSGRGRFDADFVEGRGWRFSRFEIDRTDEYRCPADLLRTPGESSR